jgi:hypothetical protein
MTDEETGDACEPEGDVIASGAVVEHASVWVFHGDRARLAAAVFPSRADGLAWVARHRLTGLLTEYPVGDGCYDIALAQGRFRPSKPHHGSSEHVAGFSASGEHIHVLDGEPR